MKTKSLIDYFTIRYAGKHDPDEVIELLLGLDSILFEAYEKSPLDGYRKSKRFGGIFVCYDPCRYKIHNSEDEALPLDRMGICVSMSGDGCRTFENMSIHRFKEEGAFSYLMEQCYLNPDIFATRVDLAIDDHSGQLDMETIILNAFSDRIDSRITSIDIHVSKKEKRYNGRSLYIGAPSSAFRIRQRNSTSPVKMVTIILGYVLKWLCVVSKHKGLLLLIVIRMILAVLLWVS